jgi:hypothetical protein
MENRIKEQFHRFAGRASTETMRANQFRMYLSGMAYALVSGLRRLGLKATELATAQAATIREKLFQIGAREQVSVRRVWLSMASSYPHQGLFQQDRLQSLAHRARSQSLSARRARVVAPWNDFPVCRPGVEDQSRDRPTAPSPLWRFTSLRTTTALAKRR